MRNALVSLAACAVISFRKEEFLAKVEQLTRRAARYNMTPPVARETGTHKVPVYRTVEGPGGLWITDEVIGWHLYFEFEVEHPTMALPGGWTFLGTVDHTENGNVLRVLCSDERSQALHLEGHRKAPPSCDHCGTIRRRNRTFLVLSESGAVRRVGSSCLRDYLGHNAAESLGVYMDAAGLAGEEWGPRSGAGIFFDAVDFVAASKAAIEEHGWRSRKDDSGGTATADFVLRLFFDVLDRKPGARPFVEAAKENFGGFAREALAWASEIPESEPNTYLQNLRVLARRGCVDPRHAGYVASLAMAFAREQERRAQEAAAKQCAGHLGSVGDKIAGTLSKKDRDAGRRAWFFHPEHQKVVPVGDTGKRALREAGLANAPAGIPATVRVRIVRESEVARGYASAYVLTTILKVQTDEGHHLTWFASGTFDDPPEPGDKVLISGTVKRHSQYKGVPETVLTRCTVTRQA